MKMKTKIKNIFWGIFKITLVIIVITSCKNEPKTGGEYNITNNISASTVNKSDNGLPIIQFKDTEYNFGVIIKGEKVAHKFDFTNTGSGNLVISNVQTSCGCTVSKYSKELVKPGESGFVELQFDSSNREIGKEQKTATVFSNTQPNTTLLTIRYNVVMK